MISKEKISGAIEEAKHLVRDGMPLLIAFGAIGAVGGVEVVGKNVAIKQESHILEEKGILGEHPIVDLKTVPGFTKNENINSGFLRTIGEFKGIPTDMLVLAWELSGKGGDIKVSPIPTSKISYLIDEDPNTEPTVSFNLDPAKFLNVDSFDKRVRAVNHSDPNAYLANSDSVVITLSKSHYDSFMGTQDK